MQRFTNLSRPLVYGGIGLVLLLIVGVVAARYWSDLRWIAAPIDLGTPLPRPAMRTHLAANLSSRSISHEVMVLEPSAKQVAQIERRYGIGVGELDASLLTEVDTGKLKYGGTALVSLDAHGETRVTIAPKRAPFFELGGDWEVGGGILYDSAAGQGFTIHAGKDLLRTGHVTTKIVADLDLVQGQPRGRAAVLGIVKF